MQPLSIDIKKRIALVIIILFLNGCSWLNPFLYFKGESGDRSNLPVEVEELIEMAEYCNRAIILQQEKINYMRYEIMNFHIM